MNPSIEHDVDVASLVDDRPQDGVFSVHRDAFTSSRVFDLEMAALFERGWVYVGLESEMPNANDYKTLNISKYPLLLMRDAAGQLGCFINSCRHRGMVLAPRQHGNQRYHTCRYHGWVFGSDGRCAEVTRQAEAGYPPSFCEQRRDLEPVPQFANYRGFLFASLSSEAPSILEHLGDARRFLDLMLDKAAAGLEFVPGASRYTFEANWKLQLENALDIYHFSYTHASYVDVLARRAEDKLKQQAKLTEQDVQGSFGFAGGHAVQWRQNARVSAELIERRQETYSNRLDDAAMRWAGYGINLTIFPNLQIVENVSSLILRVIRPLRADLTEMEVHCLAPVGESPELREARIRDYEDFFGAGGLATPDDSVIYELSQRGLLASRSEWALGYLRGMDRAALPPNNGYAQELGITPEDWTFGSRDIGDESRFHGTYRTWLRRLKGTPTASPTTLTGTAPAPDLPRASSVPVEPKAAAVVAFSTWHDVADFASLEDSLPRKVLVRDQAVALVRLGTEIHAFDDHCTHGSASLAEGKVHVGEIECPFHGGRFDIATGAATGSPCVHPVRVIPVRVRAGRVEIFAADSGAGVGHGAARVPEELKLIIASRQPVGTDIVSFELHDPSGKALPAFTAGAHVDLRLPSGSIRSYSLCNDPSAQHAYRLAVQLARPSKGGSAEVHAALHVGQLVRLSAPTNDFELDEMAEFSVLIAGGIGVTPLMAMAYRLQALGRLFVLHYTCRTADRIAFREELAERLGTSLKLYSAADGQQRFEARLALAEVSRRAALYICGPDGFVSHVESVAAELGWSPADVRKESFGGSGRPSAEPLPPH